MANKEIQISGTMRSQFKASSSLVSMKLVVAVYLVTHLMLECALKCNLQKSNNIDQRQQLSLNAAFQAYKSSDQRSQGYSPYANLTARPLDRPNLSQVSSRNSSPDQVEVVADWLMMDREDLLPDEGKNSATFATLNGNHTTLKRSGLKSKGKATNKTIFDDEQSESGDSNQIFDDIEDSPSNTGAPKEPDCAAHTRHYCTYKEEYPLKLVTEVTKYYKWPLEKLFRDLHAQIMPKLAQDSTGNLVCDSITRVVRPGWARSTNDRWLVVINTENYHQYVTEVVCQYGTNSRCNFIPPCYYSSCQQRYNTQKLLVIDPSNPYRGPFLSEFLFPSCCVCYVPTASESYQNKYRSSPATIYQRTLQQEASSNLFPPQFKPVSLVEEAPGSLPDQSASSYKSPGSSVSKQNQPLGPGEIRRAGDQYQVPGQAVSSATGTRQGRDFVGNSASYLRLGLSDSLLDQGPAEHQQ